jgi:predicted PurR-regulated permease PerM
MHRDLASGPIVWLGIIITTCLLLVLFQFVLWLVVPVLLAVVAYYILSPLVDAGIARGMTRGRAVLIVTILLSVGLVLVSLIVAPKVNEMGRNLPKTFDEYTATATTLIQNARKTASTYMPFLFPHRGKMPAPPDTNPKATPGTPPPAKVPPTDTASSTAADVEGDVADFQAKYSGDIALQLLHWIPSLLLVPYMTYFFLLDGPRFKRFIVQAIPNAFFEKTLYLFYRVEDQLRRYFQGLLALTALDATCLGIGFWSLGLNAPFLLAALAAVMAWLPYLGSIGGGLLIVLVAAHDFPLNYWLPYEVIGLFVAVRLLDDFVFLPLTVGRSLHMHPLVTVLMILLGGAVAGIAGLLLVMPVLGVVMVAGQIIGELLTDERILARHRHAQRLKKLRARADLFTE